jgi:pSer/pThr/pTyr-binding forkhead associated (FHA) protein
MAFLNRIRPDGTPIERWEVGAESLVVGRGESVNAFVEDDALSRSHFLIVAEGEEFFLIDLNSSNGTWIGDTRVTAHKLHSGEVILAGGSLFCFSTKTVPRFVIPSAIVSLLRSESEAARA